jgi:hypothetical protein
MPKLFFRLRMATHYTGFMTVVGLLALLLQAPAPALWIIAGLWLWFAQAFWFYRMDMGFGGRNRSASRLGDYTPDEMQVRLRWIWR